MSANYDLISARHHYLSTDVVIDFCSYLADYLTVRGFEPPYTTQTYRPKCQYEFVSLEDAWRQSCSEKTSREMIERIRLYEDPLREAVADRDDDKTMEIVRNLFAEKLIASNNQDWLAEHQKGMADLLWIAREILTDATPDYCVFGQSYGPRMTASFSRIYAILIGDFLCYESRVAAGLCFMVRSFCVERGIELPSELQFGRIQGWGKGKKDNGRNASWGTNVFPSIDTIKKKPTRESQYARSNILASWVMVEVLGLVRERMKDVPDFWLHSPDAMRRIEGALYMIGAELPRP